MNYLAIRNWEKYQAAKKGADWVKDYVDQDDQKEFSSLSMFVRGVLQGLRRVRGRTGRNIDNDITHIARAIYAMPTDRPHLQHAIDTLIARKILVLTDQQDDSVRLDIDKEKDTDKEVERAAESLNSLTIRIPLKTPEPSKDFNPDDVTFHVLREIGIPARNPELTVLVASAVEAKARLPNWSVEKAALHMIERGTAYKSSWVWNTKFKKSWVKWFQDECYDQHPDAWTQQGANENGSKQTALERNLEALRKANKEAGI